MEIRPALRDSIGTRIELRLNDPTESEVGRRLAAQIPGGVPGRGWSAPGVYLHLALPRVDGRGDRPTACARRRRTSWRRWSGRLVRAGGAAGTAAARTHRAVRSGRSAARPRAGVPIGVPEADLVPVAPRPHRRRSAPARLRRRRVGQDLVPADLDPALAAQSAGWEVRFVVVDYRRSLLGVVPEEHLGAYAAEPEAARVYVDQVVREAPGAAAPTGPSPAPSWPPATGGRGRRSTRGRRLRPRRGEPRACWTPSSS